MRCEALTVEGGYRVLVFNANDDIIMTAIRDQIPAEAQEVTGAAGEDIRQRMMTVPAAGMSYRRTPLSPLLL